MAGARTAPILLLTLARAPPNIALTRARQVHSLLRSRAASAAEWSRWSQTSDAHGPSCSMTRGSRRPGCNAAVRELRPRWPFRKYRVNKTYGAFTLRSPPFFLADSVLFSLALRSLLPLRLSFFSSTDVDHLDILGFDSHRPFSTNFFIPYPVEPSQREESPKKIHIVSQPRSNNST